LNGIPTLELGVFCGGALLYHVYRRLAISARLHTRLYFTLLAAVTALTVLLLITYNDFYVDPQYFLLN
jgi:hypothetical protein